jgi:hypothetical protein
MEIVTTIVGIGLIVCAIILNKTLSGRQVIDLALERLGVVLKADALGVMFILGFFLSCSGPFFLYKGYEEHIKGLETRARALEDEKSSLLKSLDKFRTYDLPVALVFQDDHPPNPFELSCDAFVQRYGGRVTASYDQARFTKAFGGITVNVEKLQQGDQWYVVVRSKDKTWRSDEMIAPNTHLMMRRISDQESGLPK